MAAYTLFWQKLTINPLWKHWNKSGKILQETSAMWDYIELQQYWMDRGQANGNGSVIGSNHKVNGKT